VRITVVFWLKEANFYSSLTKERKAIQTNGRKLRNTVKARERKKSLTYNPSTSK
jgi:hypothetical protein